MIERYSGGLHQSWHSHDDAVVTLILQGHVRECIRSPNGRTHDVLTGPLAVGIKPVGLQHANQFGPEGLHALRVCFTPGQLHRLNRYSTALDSWRWSADTATVRATLAAFLCESRVDAEHEVLVALDMGPALRAGSPPVWLARVRESVADCFRERISLGTLALLHGVHPVYLARAFRRYYGESVGQCIRRLRVHDAVRRLLHAEPNLAAIAVLCGFSDQAHMTRHMQLELGVTPGMLRRRLRGFQVRTVQDSR